MWWSVAAVGVLLVWQYFVLTASVGVFYAPHTPPQMFALVWDAKAEDFWPGEFGLSTSVWPRLVQVGPAIAAFLWTLCLVPWTQRVHRVGGVLVALILPASQFGMLAYYTPLVPFYGPYYGLKLSATGGTGKDHEFGAAIIGPGLWFWLVLPVLILAAREHRKRPGLCPTCSYPLAGLPGPVCPECGAGPSSAPAKE